jgi:flagellin
MSGLSGKMPETTPKGISEMLSIQTNVNSLVAQENLNINNEFQSKTIQQLTSGYRINSSGDDAAGLAIANQYRNSVAELTQGVANGNDGVAQLQIMDGGMSNISQILDRLKTLATTSSSATFTGNRGVLNGEFQTDITEIDRQAQAIGLNTGGTFAQSLGVYLGGGGGTTTASTLANGMVTVNLANSTVDSQSLG